MIGKSRTTSIKERGRCYNTTHPAEEGCGEDTGVSPVRAEGKHPLKAEGGELGLLGKSENEHRVGRGELLPLPSLPLPSPLPLRTTVAKGFKDICEGGPLSTRQGCNRTKSRV